MLYSELLRLSDVKTALDAGCGNGRNSIFLANMGARVEAVDFSKVALSAARTRLEKENLTDKVTLHEWNLYRQLPFKEESFDLCLDMYVSCHFLDEGTKNRYVAELLRLTKPGGLVITAVFDKKDEYYSSMINPGAVQKYVTDPANGITKELYDELGFKNAFSPPFSIGYYVELQFKDRVKDRTYQRRILSMALQKHA